MRQAQGPWKDLALHTLGWKAFQDLAAHVCEEILQCPVEVFREAKDGGQDAVFLRRDDKAGKVAEPTTIQCKFSANSNKSFKLSDLTIEEKNIVELNKLGQARNYILITNMPIAAGAAVQIKQKLKELGVKHAHVFGKDFLVKCIRGSTKLRALVPRVYGLGDLSLILDERKAEQTKALLGHLIPTLKVYVPTQAHVDAVHALAKNKIVLLLGDPATGKSTIGAILATIAAENNDHRSFKVDGPHELIEQWNPNEPGGFYWIDDAFGPNQMREDFVDQWIAIMPKVQTAIAQGNIFLLTSRRHIYEAAKPKLGSRNHPLLRNEQAIVQVGSLKHEERAQIIYNHVRGGQQATHWKRQVKTHLDALANEPSFLPEIARRLADPAYTKGLNLNRESLLRFFREPREHLIQTINELSQEHRAALALVFLHRSNMPSGNLNSAMRELVIKQFGIDADSLGQSILQLKDSFLVEKSDGGVRSWTFKHPTIADAITKILATDGLAELYLRGAKPQTIVSEVVCAEAGADFVKDALVIGSEFDDILAERLEELPDEALSNRSLFSFLESRSSDNAFKKFITRQPNVFSRKAYESRLASYDPKILTFAKALRLSLLPQSHRKEICIRLESSLFDDYDASFLENNEILALFDPLALLTFPNRIKRQLLAKLPNYIESLVEDADIDGDPDDLFEDLESTIARFREIFEDEEEAIEKIETAEIEIESGKERLKKERKKQAQQGVDWDWEDYGRELDFSRSQTTRSAPQRIEMNRSSDTPRSIFSDVDE